MLDSSILERLTSEDDPALRDVATSTILADAEMEGRESGEDIVAQLGCCRHWIRPHEMRWTADGGFWHLSGTTKLLLAIPLEPCLSWIGRLGSLEAAKKAIDVLAKLA
jgi:hypothetical protein